MSIKARVASTLLAVTIAFSPAAAMAATHSWTFYTTDLPAPTNWRKGPDNTAKWTNNNGTISMDVATCPNPRAKFAGEFKRKIKNFPDYRVALADNQDYCMPAYVVKRKITKGHTYYFRATDLRFYDTPRAKATFKWTY